MLKQDFLTMHRSTWAAPALVSSASRGPSSPFLVAVRSLSEYRWRSSVRWPGTVSKESRRLRETRGSGWKQKMITLCATKQKNLYPEAGHRREGSWAEVMKVGNTQPNQCSRLPQLSHTIRCLDGRSDFYTLLQSDSCQLAKSGRPAHISPSREKNTDTVTAVAFSFTISGIFCKIPLLSSHNKGNCWDMFLSKICSARGLWPPFKTYSLANRQVLNMFFMRYSWIRSS